MGNPAHDLIRLALSLASSARGSGLPGVTTVRMLEFECLRKQRLATKAEARRAIARYIDRYNRIRRHSSCEMKSPVDYEAILAARAAKDAPDEEAA